MLSNSRARARAHAHTPHPWRRVLTVALTFTLAWVGSTFPMSNATDAADAAVADTADTAGAGRTDVVLLGDSMTALAFGYLGGPTSDAPDRLLPFFTAGWTLRDAAASAGPAVSTPGTDVLILAVGANDAAPWDGGWTSTDVDYWTAVLESVPSKTCVTVVLPGWADALDGTPWAQGMTRMRKDTRRLVADRQATGAPTYTIDWHRVVDDHPEYIAPDGIHIATSGAAATLQGLYWSAAAHCREFHPS